MTSVPPFSLLLPVYFGDSPQFLERAFRSSVIDQSLPPNEVVIVQDGPVGDDLKASITALVASSPVPIVFVEIEENGGLADALTSGLAHCSHDIVARMDADDISERTRFEAQLSLVAEGYELVGTGMVEFTLEDDGREVPGRRRVPPVLPDDIDKYSRFHDPFNHPTVVYSKAAVARAGGYVPLGLMEDYWLFARMIASGARVINIADPLVRYRISSGAYRRRGGIPLLASEWKLQRAFLASGFTNRLEFSRNLLLRGGYRLVPEWLRKVAYRRIILRARWATTEST